MIGEARKTGAEPGRGRRIWPIVAVFLVLGLGLYQGLARRPPPQTVTLQGETMGTTYRVIAHGRPGFTAPEIRAELERRLAGINRIMSTWDPESEISRLNDAPAADSRPISGEFERVLAASLDWGRETGGALDITIAPLVDLWGFGPEKITRPPTSGQIARAMERIGFQSLRLEPGRLTKLKPGMRLDFSATAKGYAVDEMAALLRTRGLSDFLVEIGGEVVVSGLSPEGGPWRIGLESPERGIPGQAIHAAVALTNGALATSGSYRRYQKFKAMDSHHIIDPATGRPANHDLVSVTVYAADCLTADGIATALLVMGQPKGLRWVEARPGVEALFMEIKEGGGFKRTASTGFPPLLP